MKNLSMREYSALSAALVLSVLSALSTGCGKSATTTTEAATLPPPQVVVETVEQKTVPIFSEFVGQTKAFETVEIRARIEGVLEKLYFAEGSPVRKGQLLATIDKREYQAKLQTAKALGISRRSVYRLIEKYGLAPKSDTNAAAEEPLEAATGAIPD